MIRLAFRNLFHRKTRTLLTVTAVALEVTLILLLTGLANGTLREAGQRIENIRSDIIVLPPGAQFVLGMSTAVMPLEPVRALLESTEDVLGAAPVAFASTNAFGSFSLVFGIEPRSYDLAGRGALEVIEGRGLENADDLLVDARLARAKGLRVGDRVELLNHEFTLGGIVRDGAGVRIYMPIATLQDLLGRQGKASVFFLRVNSADNVGAVLDRLRRTPAFKGYSIFPSSQYTELLGVNTVGIKQFNAAIVTIALTFGLVVIALSMYTTILERTRLIGILKSIGAGRLFILGEIVLEALMLSLLGIPLGLVLTSIAESLLHVAYPTLIIEVMPVWIYRAAGLSIASAVVGALYPAYRASSVDPVEALNYE